MEGMDIEEMRKEVEKVSEKVILEENEAKGRFLRAKMALKTGEVVLSERPLLVGSIEAVHSRKVYSDTFLEKLNAFEDFKEDCFHPRSPLIDCIAAVLLCKMSRPELFRRFCSLSRCPGDHEECVSELYEALRPEFQELASKEELRLIFEVLSSNRFGHDAGRMQLMFAGSIFEHSCLPNCFLGPPSDPQSYRALRDISEGEPLSIDYLNFPGGYGPASVRAQAFRRWGFTCRCARCEALPEVERSFVCNRCRAPELCPARPGDGALRCLACEQPADAAYAAQCLQREEELQGDNPKQLEEDLLGHKHHLVLHALWQDVQEGLPDPEELPAFQQMLEALVESLAAACRMEQHPAMLNLYHLAAVAAQDDLELQKRYLQLEHRIFQRFYPDEAARQDAEIMALVTYNGPAKESFWEMD